MGHQPKVTVWLLDIKKQGWPEVGCGDQEREILTMIEGMAALMNSYMEDVR